jgi:hypothetical protein
MFGQRGADAILYAGLFLDDVYPMTNQLTVLSCFMIA